MNIVSIYAIPALILIIITLGFIQKVPLFDCFLSGAKDGLGTALRILPSLVGLLAAVSMLKASGALDLLSYALAPLGRLVLLPKEVIPLALLRPVSGSGGLALMENVFKHHGPDSVAGKAASILAGATETTFYTITVYYGSVGIKKMRQSIPAALAGDLAAANIHLLFTTDLI